jgi:hypothetical protein
MMGFPPTGKEITFSGIVSTRVADGKMVEIWENYDSLSLLEELGGIKRISPEATRPALSPLSLVETNSSPRPPVIDVHLHAMKLNRSAAGRSSKRLSIGAKLSSKPPKDIDPTGAALACASAASRW